MDAINSIDILAYSNKPYKTAHNERTAGSFPVYENFLSTSLAARRQEQSEALAFKTLVTTSLMQEQAVAGEDEAQNYIYALEEQDNAQDKDDSGFNLFDLIDMVNPLQHIPVLNYAYRGLTGDSIKPISAILGGALFAGPIGAASGLVTAVIEEEAGKSLPSALASFTGKAPSSTQDYASSQRQAYDALEPHMLAFAAPPRAIDANYDYN